MSAAHRCASARVFCGKASRCGKIEKSTTPRVRSSGTDGQWAKSGPIRGVITMLPALTPTQTMSGNDGSRSASPDSRIQWHRYDASPPSTRSASASRTHGTHRSAPMVGSAVSSGRPSDAQKSPEKCWKSGSAATRPRTDSGPHIGWTPLRRRDDQGMALRDRLPEQLHERRADAWVRDTAGREQELQGASTWARNRWDVLKTRHGAGTHRGPGSLFTKPPTS